MRTTNDFKDFVLEQLQELQPIKCHPMMGEYLLYYNDILFGGLYNNRLLIKKTKSNELFHLEEQIPYEGAKSMYFIEDLEEKEKIQEIILATCKDLPKKKSIK